MERKGKSTFSYGDSLSKTLLAEEVSKLTHLVLTGVFQGPIRVYGSWDLWREGRKLEERKEGLCVTVELTPGSYEYKYQKLNGEWFHDHRQVPNNSILGADTMDSLQGADTMDSLQGADTMDSLQGADTMDSLQGADTMDSIQGAHLMDSLQGPKDIKASGKDSIVRKLKFWRKSTSDQRKQRKQKPNKKSSFFGGLLRIIRRITKKSP
ncbi:PREDICTED: uncharacterized protein LOC109481511 [Branchiostoma belcheri]|uniref:Uncharacterized protein LOC109481511 n=1 Tax=Branchiostoma belcheri TaxID=7741 RepID=A0A6P5A8K3_BRABE|nr:PREDICTED: uncharacterized protein LOC109481511 [Branchiostoma belcheri]